MEQRPLTPEGASRLGIEGNTPFDPTHTHTHTTLPPPPPPPALIQDKETDLFFEDSE